MAKQNKDELKFKSMDFILLQNLNTKVIERAKYICEKLYPYKDDLDYNKDLHGSDLFSLCDLGNCFEFYISDFNFKCPDPCIDITGIDRDGDRVISSLATVLLKASDNDIDDLVKKGIANHKAKEEERKRVMKSRLEERKQKKADEEYQLYLKLKEKFEK